MVVVAVTANRVAAIAGGGELNSFFAPGYALVLHNEDPNSRKQPRGHVWESKCSHTQRPPAHTSCVVPGAAPGRLLVVTFAARRTSTVREWLVKCSHPASCIHRAPTHDLSAMIYRRWHNGFTDLGAQAPRGRSKLAPMSWGPYLYHIYGGGGASLKRPLGRVAAKREW